jgi:ABC-type sugar transport system substrate-binding protein
MTMKKLFLFSICSFLAIGLSGCGKPNAKNKGKDDGSSGLSAEGAHIQIVSIQDGGGAKDQGFKSAADALQSHPDLRGIFAINDPSALGAHAALQQKEKAGQIAIVGFDGQLIGKQAIKDGIIIADPIQFPDQMGIRTVQNIRNYFLGKPFDKVELIPTKLYTKADADKDPELGDDPPTQSQPSDVKGDAGTIGVSVLTLTNPFFQVIADNIKAEAAKHDYRVEVVSGDEDVNKQSGQVDAFIAKKVKAIVLNPCDRTAIGPAIVKANKAGIPVFTCDLQCVHEGAKVAGHVGTDNYQGGKLAGQAMIDALGEQGGKVLILHYPQANSCVLRVKGFTEVIEAHNKKRAGN